MNSNPFSTFLAFAIAVSPCAATAQGAPPSQTVPRYEGLGGFSRKVTASPEAQVYFDQGLSFLYAFNHDEAIRSFQHAAELDPQSPMPLWGVALANGPHINNMAVPPEREKAAFDALVKARALVGKASPAEKTLIEALSARYADPQPKDRSALNQAYATAMRAAWAKYPKDADVGALFAESLANLRPWDLWLPDGRPQPGTEELVRTIEAVLVIAPKHPFANHLMIHAVEASRNPGKADRAADALRDLQPGLGHLVHMPSHIDVRRGRWAKAVEANEKAIRADAAYTKKSPKQGFYHLYMAHNHHMLAFAAMQRGQSKKAMDAVAGMVAGVPKEWVAVKENAAIADGFLAAPLEVMVRFGKWDDILKQPEPPEAFPIARALRHHARGVALAATGKPKEAREELDELRKAAKAMPKEAHFGNNAASDLLAVAEPMLEGEILAAEGKLADAVKVLGEAVKAEDKLRYDEPPDWVIPVRHALGAFLLKAGKLVEAEAVYRDDLKKWPDNGWSLFGLAQTLDMQGKKDEAEMVRAKWKTAWADADTKLHASCLCAPAK
jgi:tetratricopeptide (TPR) repeat protein